MRAAGKRSVLCLAAMALAVSFASSVCAAGKQAKAASEKPQMSFRVKPEAARPLDLSPNTTGFAARDLDAFEGDLAGFDLSPAAVAGDVRLLDSDRYYAGAGPVTWRSNAIVRQAQAGGPIDAVRVSVAGSAPTAAFAPLTLQRPDAYEVREVDVTVLRGWPSAVSLAGRKYALDVTPHAGVGFGGAGGSAEAGATLRLGKKKNMGDRVTDALGVREGDEAFGDRGRWYIFAAASGRAVGFNMLRGQNGDWNRAGLSQDVTSQLIGDSQAGVAWRKGPMQASLGYIHREIRAKEGIMGLATQKDDVVALSFSLKPHW
ncbi:lipid A-modifier LpxR family protein [Caulobacter sp.]|uniref:lipid A-modifier LpxR family protein n=1 Tax=Caulobacter sp. TaxID=78 RepID=UPI00160F049B